MSSITNQTIPSSNIALRTKVIDGVTLTSILALTVMLFLYNLFSNNYLPNDGTGVVYMILSVLSIVFISTNLLLGNVNIKDLFTNFISAMKNYNIFNAVILATILPAFIGLSYVFTKFKDIINKHHANIPSFDFFFMFVTFSVFIQLLYVNGTHHVTKLTSIIRQNAPPSIEKLFGFLTLNYINILMIIAMWAGIKFSVTDG